MKRALAATAVALLFVTATLSQLLLPHLAEGRMREELETVGDVTSLQVTATPAVKLLFGAVDRVRVGMGRAVLDGAGLDPAVTAKARRVQDLELRIDELSVGPFRATQVAVDKEGDQLSLAGTVRLEELQSLIPGAQVRVEDGTIVLDLSAVGLPLPGPVQMEIVIDAGRVVARPRGLMAAMLPPQPLLDRPELSMEGLHAQLLDGALEVNGSAVLSDA